MLIRHAGSSVAGAETTSVSIRLILLSLLTTPEAYRKLQAEIDAYYAERAAHGADPNSVISYAHSKSLLYLQGAIREGMRLWPPSAGLFSRDVPKAGDTIHGYYLPPGTEIGQSMYGIGRRRDLWGEDADVFRPERWLEANPEKLREMHAACDLNFSSGKYVCLGRSIALMEISKFFVEVCCQLRTPFATFKLELVVLKTSVLPPQILRRYEIASMNPPEPVKMIDPLTWQPRDFWIRFSKRGKREA